MFKQIWGGPAGRPRAEHISIPRFCLAFCWVQKLRQNRQILMQVWAKKVDQKLTILCDPRRRGAWVGSPPRRNFSHQHYASFWLVNGLTDYRMTPTVSQTFQAKGGVSGVRVVRHPASSFWAAHWQILASAPLFMRIHHKNAIFMATVFHKCFFASCRHIVADSCFGCLQLVVFGGGIHLRKRGNQYA